jgi:hypothetical protein
MDNPAFHLTQHELAERFRLSGRTLERWRAAHYGPAWITLGGSIRYRMSDVLAWEAAHLTQP